MLVVPMGVKAEGAGPVFPGPFIIEGRKEPVYCLDRGREILTGEWRTVWKIKNKIYHTSSPGHMDADERLKHELAQLPKERGNRRRLAKMRKAKHSRSGAYL